MSGQPGVDDAAESPSMPDMAGHPGHFRRPGSASATAGHVGRPCDRTRSGALLPGAWATAADRDSAFEAGRAKTAAARGNSTSARSSVRPAGSAGGNVRLASAPAPSQARPAGGGVSRPGSAGTGWPDGDASSRPGLLGAGSFVGGDAGSGDGAGGDGAGGDGAGGDGAGGDEGNGGPRSPRRLSFLRGTDGRRRGRLALLVAALALACTILGGVVGGFVVLHTQSPQTDPTYTLGTVPPALTSRPASSVAGIAARVTPSVVMIKVNGGEGTGSGFIIQGGYIVTDNYVVTLDGQVTNSSLEVYFANGQSEPAAVVGRDPFSDIAVIKAVGSASMPALTLGNSAAVDVGDPVLAVGSPLGLADTVTSGIVSAVNRPVQPGAAAGSTSQVYFDAIQTDAPINPGNSGGPLVNARGQVIGVDAAIDTLGANPLMGTQGGSIGLGFAIPINQVRRVAVELIRTGRATHSVLGAVINTGWGGTGAMIAGARPGSPSTVTPGSPAALAGLRPGDVIIRFAGQPVTNGDTLLDAVRSLPPGQNVSVTFLRSGQTHTVSLRLGSAQSLPVLAAATDFPRARGFGSAPPAV